MDAHIKAVPVNSLVQFVQKELRPEQLKSVLDRLPPGQAALFSGHLLASEQVSLEPVNLFTMYAAEAKGEPVKSFGRRAGRYSATQGLKTVYKFLMIMMSVETVLKKAPFMWTRVYDTGTLLIESTANTARLQLKDFPSHEAGCARITGWFEQIGETAGAQALNLAHTSCAARGEKQCVWDLSWKK